jgi:hypothetical protein
MSDIKSQRLQTEFPSATWADGEAALFKPGDRVRVAWRFPIGHYRAPRYIRGKSGLVESVIEPRAVNNEEEGFGRNAGSRRHYYRVALSMEELWQGDAESVQDQLKIEVFETWLEKE